MNYIFLNIFSNYDIFTILKVMNSLLIPPNNIFAEHLFFDIYLNLRLYWGIFFSNLHLNRYKIQK